MEAFQEKSKQNKNQEENIVTQKESISNTNKLESVISSAKTNAQKWTGVLKSKWNALLSNDMIKKNKGKFSEMAKNSFTPKKVMITSSIIVAFAMGVFSVNVDEITKKNENLIKQAEHEGFFYEMAYEKRPPVYPMETLAKLDSQISIFPLMTKYELKVDAQVVGTFADVDTPKAILSNLVSLSDESFYEDVKFSYAEDVHIEKSIVPAYKIGKYDEFEPALNYVKSGQKESVKYTVVKGDYIEKIAKKFDVTTKDLIEINPVVLSKKYLNIGDELVIMRSKPLINARLSYVQEYTESIEAEVELQKSADMYEGEKKTVSEGSDGEQKVVARIVKNNGLEIEKKILESEVLKEPVKKVVMVGTKVAPVRYVASAVQSRSKVSYAQESKELRGGLKLQRPMQSYLITSRYGSRWGSFHQGIDLAGPVGTPVYAAESGTVTVSTTNGRGYGYYIKINHGSGVSTMYAHCSQLLVEAGQTVEKGQLIAKSGNTGRSTGPHLHFEVLIDGNAQNPEKYCNF